MKISIILLSLAATAFLLAGCNTIGSRIRQNRETFDSLSLNEQKAIKRGIVRLGYTTDMVYMALGEPDEVTESAIPLRWRNIHETTWTYKVCGFFDVSYRRYDYGGVFMEYTTARVVFRDGKAVSVMQSTPPPTARSETLGDQPSRFSEFESRHEPPAQQSTLSYSTYPYR